MKKSFLVSVAALILLAANSAYAVEVLSCKSNDLLDTQFKSIGFVTYDVAIVAGKLADKVHVTALGHDYGMMDIETGSRFDFEKNTGSMGIQSNEHFHFLGFVLSLQRMPNGEQVLAGVFDVVFKGPLRPIGKSSGADTGEEYWEVGMFCKIL